MACCGAADVELLRTYALEAPGVRTVLDMGNNFFRQRLEQNKEVSEALLYTYIYIEDVLMFIYYSIMNLTVGEESDCVCNSCHRVGEAWIQRGPRRPPPSAADAQRPRYLPRCWHTCLAPAL